MRHPISRAPTPAPTPMPACAAVERVGPVPVFVDALGMFVGGVTGLLSPGPKSTGVGVLGESEDDVVGDPADDVEDASDDVSVEGTVIVVVTRVGSTDGFLPPYQDRVPPRLVGSSATLSSFGLSEMTWVSLEHLQRAGGFEPGTSPVSLHAAHISSPSSISGLSSQRCSPVHCWLPYFPLYGQLGALYFWSVQPAR